MTNRGTPHPVRSAYKIATPWKRQSSNGSDNNKMEIERELVGLIRQLALWADDTEDEMKAEMIERYGSVVAYAEQCMLRLKNL